MAIARKHFTEYGYLDVSLDKIAEEGNVTRGAVYHHFKNKQGLFTAVLECVEKDVCIKIEQEAIKSDDLWQQLILGCVGFVNGANISGALNELALNDSKNVLANCDDKMIDTITHLVCGFQKI